MFNADIPTSIKYPTAEINPQFYKPCEVSSNVIPLDLAKQLAENKPDLGAYLVQGTASSPGTIASGVQPGNQTYTYPISIYGPVLEEEINLQNYANNFSEKAETRRF